MAADPSSVMEIESLTRADVVDGEASESDDDQPGGERSHPDDDAELELGEEAATGVRHGDNTVNDIDDDIGDADDLVNSEEDDEDDDRLDQDYNAGCAKVYDGEADESDEDDEDDDDDDEESSQLDESSSRPPVQAPMPIVIALKRTDLVTAKSARDPASKPPPPPAAVDARSNTPSDPPPESRLTTKYNSVLHVKLAETNAALRDSIVTRCQKIQQRWRKTLESTLQEFQRTHETTRKVSDTMRHLTNGLFKLDDTADAVVSAPHIPDIKID